MEEIRKIQTANPSEWEKVTAFLRERDLPVRREYADACFGAFVGGRLVGTVILSGSVVRNTAVDPEMRHKGIVEKLFTAVIEEARERGIFYLQLFTKSQNAQAFSGAGFRLVENHAILILHDREWLQALREHLRGRREPKCVVFGCYC